MSIPEKILQAGCDAYAATFLNGNGSLGDGIEAAYLAIHEHDDWVRAGPPAWTGEGLPPAGTVCEHKRVHEWQKVEVFAVKPNYNGSHTALFTYENGCWAGCAEPSSFRPLRTPEQIAEEERAIAIDDLMRTTCINHGEATRIYDAGYRKQVAP